MIGNFSTEKNVLLKILTLHKVIWHFCYIFKIIKYTDFIFKRKTLYLDAYSVLFIRKSKKKIKEQKDINCFRTNEVFILKTKNKNILSKEEHITL